MSWLLFILLFLTSCRQEVHEQSPRPVKTIQVKETSFLENEIVFPGTLRAFKRADLSFRVDGIVIMRDIYVGYRTQKGELLMQLDPREYEIALKKAEGNLESVQAQLDFASRDFQRMQHIFERDPGAISESYLDRKEESRNKFEAQISVAQAEVEQAADNLSYTSLNAPFNGIITAIYVENYEQVRAKQSVLRLLDTEEREMEINVPEKLVNSLLEGKDRLYFEVRLDAFPDENFKGTIKEIGTEASSTTQTFPVTLSLEDIPVEISLLAGMSGRALLKQPLEGLKDNTFKIPKSAIFTEDGERTYVWIVDPMTQTVHKQAVTTDGTYKGNAIIIREGLSNGDIIVTAGTHFLVEGQQVKIDKEQPKP
ncbi:MAG: efflux RND transporter periplasmic adaptor subunit [Chlamydiales bacterium]